MDPLTHALAGYLIATSFKKPAAPLNNHETKLAIIGATLPDIDFVTRFKGIEFFLKYHRGLTHSLLAAPLLVLLICGIGEYFWPKLNMKKAFLLTSLGVLSHLFLDVVTSYGTHIFFPFTRTPVSWDWITIIDPYLLSALILSAYLCHRFKPAAKNIALYFLLGISFYLLGRGLLYDYSYAEVAAEMEKAEVGLYPNFFNLSRWRLIVSDADEYRYAVLTIFPTRINWVKTLPKEVTPLCVKSKENSSIQELIRFSRFPYCRQLNEQTVEWRDLRYYRGREKSFMTMLLYFDKDGQPTNVSYNF